MTKQSSSTLLSLLIVALLIASQAIYTVDERKYALKFQFGEIVSVQTTPGLSWKIPMIQNVNFYDKRNLTLNNANAISIMTSEKKPLSIDYVVLWRISNVKDYYISVSGDEERAKQQIEQNVTALLTEEINKRSIHDVISGERDKIMAATRSKASKNVESKGVEIVDVRLRRVDFPTNVTDSVYERMKAERSRVAQELRATGTAESEKIRAEADRQRQVIVAEAYRKAQEIKGKGDAESAAIYANAYGVDPEFYTFYRSLDAYKSSLKNNSDVLVIDPSSDFFRYFKNFKRNG
ncbi:MAG: protease modulator HflC [Burkholderiales bacterium]|nr:protease modulator HflC [Burkholderiales bacterium]